MTITIAAVMYSSVESKPENTSLKSAKYPAGPVTYTFSPPVSAWAMERISSTRGASSSQPLPSSATLIGTTTCNAWPSSDGIGPTTLPVTSWMPANRCDVGGGLGLVGRGDRAVGTLVHDQGREHVAGREPLGQLDHLGRLGVVGQPGRRVVLLGAVELGRQRPRDREHHDPEAQHHPLAPASTRKTYDPSHSAPAALTVRWVVAAGDRAPGGLSSITEYSHRRISDRVSSSSLQAVPRWAWERPGSGRSAREAASLKDRGHWGVLCWRGPNIGRRPGAAWGWPALDPAGTSPFPGDVHLASSRRFHLRWRRMNDSAPRRGLDLRAIGVLMGCSRPGRSGRFMTGRCQEGRSRPDGLRRSIGLRGRRRCCRLATRSCRRRGVAASRRGIGPRCIALLHLSCQLGSVRRTRAARGQGCGPWRAGHAGPWSATAR